MGSKKNKGLKSSSLLQLDPADYSGLKFTMREFGLSPNKYLSMDCWVTWIGEINKLSIGRIDILSKEDQKLMDIARERMGDGLKRRLSSMSMVSGFIETSPYDYRDFGGLARMAREQKRKKNRRYMK